MDHNRPKKTKTVRTLIETNGERYEIQYEVGENEIDSVAQAQALQLFIDNYAATQSKTLQFQPQQAPEPQQQVQEQILPEEECILPDVSSERAFAHTALHGGSVQHRPAVIEIDESDEERADVKPDIKYVPPPPPVDPDDLEAQISASVILVDEFKNAKMPANTSTNDANSRSARLSKEELKNIDKNDKSFSNAYKAFAVSCPDMLGFSDRKRRYVRNARDGEESPEIVIPTTFATISAPSTQHIAAASPVTQTVTSKSAKAPPIQISVPATSTGLLPKITTVWSAKSGVQSTNATASQPSIVVSPPVTTNMPHKMRRMAAPTPNITMTMTPTARMSDPGNLLTVQTSKTLEQISREDEAARNQRMQRGRGRAAKRPLDPPPSAIKTSVITPVPKVEQPDTPMVTYQTVASPATSAVAPATQQAYSLNQPTAVVIDGQYYLLQAVANEPTPPAQQINNAIQPIVAQSLQPFLQQHHQQQHQQQTQQVYQHVQTAPAEQPVQDVYRNAPIMIVNQPNFHIAPNNTTPVATATTSSNNASASQTIILTDEQYNNYASQLQLLQQPAQQQQPVPIQLHQNPMSYTNQQQTQVIVTPVRRGQKKNVVVGTEDLQFIEYQDLINDVNNVSKKYY